MPTTAPPASILYPQAQGRRVWINGQAGTTARIIRGAMPIGQHLSILEAADLVRLVESQPELEYLFRHALIRDAAYASLVRANRRALHRAVAEDLE